MTVATEPQSAALRRLAVEEGDAWEEYLAATREQPAARYRECEPWAWAKLQNRLRAIRARRDRVYARGPRR